MKTKVYRLPGFFSQRKTTRDAVVYSRAWQREARALISNTGWVLDAFDPDFRFDTGSGTLTLNLVQLRQLTRRLRTKNK